MAGGWERPGKRNVGSAYTVFVKAQSQARAGAKQEGTSSPGATQRVGGTLEKKSVKKFRNGRGNK